MISLGVIISGNININSLFLLRSQTITFDFGATIVKERKLNFKLLLFLILS